MDRPIHSYNDNLKILNIREEMTRRFNDLYVLNKRKKTDFLETNEEKSVIRLGKFIPGKIYTFFYDPLTKDKLSYYDIRPIILCNKVFTAKKTDNYIVSGINLNFLPEKVRVKLLDSFYEEFEDEINKSYDMGGEGRVNVNVREIIEFFDDWQEVLKYFGIAKGIGYQFAYRNYIIKRIELLRYVEYQHWEMIPLLKTENIIGETPEKIYTLYWKKLMDNIKKIKRK